MRYGDLTYKELSEGSRQGWLAIVPTGCTEQQGPHLPVDLDTWFVEQVTLVASVKAEQDFGVFSVVLPAIPLLLKYQGTGKIHAVMQEEFMDSLYLDLDGYMGLVQFGAGPAPAVYKDWRHELGDGQPSADPKRGGGLVIQASRNEFYLVGVNFWLILRPKPYPDRMQAPLLVADSTGRFQGPPISVDEGHFNQNGKFVVDRPHNGDQIVRGV